MSSFAKLCVIGLVLSPRSFAFFHVIAPFAQYYQTTKINVPRWVEKYVGIESSKDVYSTQNDIFNSLFVKSIATTETPQYLEEGSLCRRSFDNKSGYCMLADRCLHVMREYRVHGVKIDICTYHRSIPVICCPLADKVVDDPSSKRISARKCEQYQQKAIGTRFYARRNFTGKFCVQSLPLIVGGEVTNKDEHPHMAAIGWTQSDGRRKWACGGSLISEQFILTVGHCTESNGKVPDVVRLGAQSLDSSADYIQDIKIEVIFLHPKYKASLYYHDIALLKLASEVVFTQQVQPACLWQQPNVNIRKAVATGWGRTDFMGPMSNELLKVELNIIGQDVCKDVYKTERRLPNGIVDKQFCAGHMEGGKDTCQGDSGGPLIAELPEFNCVKFVMGLTSFGKFCAAANAPGVYTNVYSYLSWIEKIVFQ